MPSGGSCTRGSYRRRWLKYSEFCSSISIWVKFSEANDFTLSGGAALGDGFLFNSLGANLHEEATISLDWRWFGKVLSGCVGLITPGAQRADSAVRGAKPAPLDRSGVNLPKLMPGYPRLNGSV